MALPQYRAYLKSRKWAEPERRYYERHHRRRVACGTYSFKRRIHVYHSSYERLSREPDSGRWPRCASAGGWLPFVSKGCHDNVREA
jgi:hypothetical protein